MTTFLLAPKTSLYLCLAALLPGCATVAALAGHSAADAVADAVPPERVPGDGITGEIHQRHVGTIVWSKSRIDKDSPDEAAFTQRFADTDTLYGRAYLPHSIENHFVTAGSGLELNSGCGLYYRVYVDGEKQGWTIENVMDSTGRRTDARCRATTRQVSIRPNPSDEPMSAAWKDIVDALPPGDHEVRVEMMTRTGSWESKEPAAVGTFTLARGTEPIVFGESFADVPAGMDDDALEERLLGIVRAKGDREGWKESFEAIKIRDQDWQVVSYEHVDQVKGREISAWALARWPDGHCTIQRFSFQQDYNGIGFGDATTRWTGTGEQRQLDCE